MAEPRPEVFHAICARSGVDPAATLHVGDDQGPFDEPRRMHSLTEVGRFLP